MRPAVTKGSLNRVSRDAEINTVLSTLMTKQWVVFSKACPRRTQGVIDYLGRYSYRIAISDQRILKIDADRVHFSAKDYTRDGQRCVVTLETTEFIRRYLLHVLPKGLMRIRHYGFLANRGRKKKLACIREALQRTSDERQPCEVPSLGKSNEPWIICPRCKVGHLRIGGLLSPTATTRLRRPERVKNLH